MSISEQALWLLCGVGAVVFSAGAVELRRVLGLIGGFVLMTWLLRGGNVADPAAVAGFTAIVAGCKLYRPHWTTLPAFCGGVLAAVLGGSLANQGVVTPVAFAAAWVIPILAVVLSDRVAGFAPVAILEEGVLLTLAVSLGAAVGPAILDGWQSAGSLNNVAEAANRAMPVWVLATAGASLLIGGAWSLWRHR